MTGYVQSVGPMCSVLGRMCSVFGPMCSFSGRMCSLWRGRCSVFGGGRWLGIGDGGKARFAPSASSGQPQGRFFGDDGMTGDVSTLLGQCAQFLARCVNFSSECVQFCRNVFSFWVNVSTLAGDVSSFWRCALVGDGAWKECEIPRLRCAALGMTTAAGEVRSGCVRGRGDRLRWD